jgi:hypothetical protein
MTRIDPNFSANNALPAAAPGDATPREREVMNYIHDELTSLGTQIEETLTESKAHDNKPIRSPWAEITQFFASCWRCITSAFSRGH